MVLDELQSLKFYVFLNNLYFVLDILSLLIDYGISVLLKIRCEKVSYVSKEKKIKDYLDLDSINNV